MQNISGFGLRVEIKASVSFPNGFTITQFADDGDSLDTPSIDIKDKAMGMNGDLLVWARPVPLDRTLNVVAGSEDDKNLAALFDANRVALGKNGTQDIITMTTVWPDGSSDTYTKGAIVSGMPGNSATSAGRLKSKAYGFTFENKVDSNG